MNYQRLLQMFSLTLVALLLIACGASTPTPIPVTVEDVQLQITSVTKQKTYEYNFAGQTLERWRATSGFVFLVVEAESPSGDIPGTETVYEWQVAIIDENGEKHDPSFLQFGGNSGRWVIAVPTDSQSFTLHLPGEQTVNLDSFLNAGWW